MTGMAAPTPGRSAQPSVAGLEPQQGVRIEENAHVSALPGFDLLVGQRLEEAPVDPGAPAPPPDATGLFHVALLLPDRAALARALLRIEERLGDRAIYRGRAELRS